MFNDTKQNVVASSEYECLIWGDRGDLGKGGGADKRLSEGSAAELKYTSREGKAVNGAGCLHTQNMWHLFLGGAG